MNWDAIGAVGEIIGALAVIVTLVYLSIQIRQNTETERANALDASITAFSAIRALALENADVSALYLKGLKAPETLNETEEFRYQLLVHNIFLSFWHIYTQSRYAELPGDIWEVQEPSIARVACSPGGKWFWENHRMEFEAPFRAEIESIVARHS